MRRVALLALARSITRRLGSRDLEGHLEVNCLLGEISRLNTELAKQKKKQKRKAK